MDRNNFGFLAQVISVSLVELNHHDKRVRGGGGWKRRSGWDGSHVGWMRKAVKLVLDGEGILEL